jgi:hypothetical protein
MSGVVHHHPSPHQPQRRKDRNAVDALVKIGARDVTVMHGAVIFRIGGQSFRLAAGKLSGHATKAQLRQLVGRIWPAYSKMIVKRAAERSGWTIEERDETHLVASKPY